MASLLIAWGMGFGTFEVFEATEEDEADALAEEKGRNRDVNGVGLISLPEG